MINAYNIRTGKWLGELRRPNGHAVADRRPVGPAVRKRRDGRPQVAALQRRDRRRGPRPLRPDPRRPLAPRRQPGPGPTRPGPGGAWRRETAVPDANVSRHVQERGLTPSLRQGASMCACSGRPDACPSMRATAARAWSDQRIRRCSTVAPLRTTSTARTRPVVYVQCAVPDTATPGTNAARWKRERRQVPARVRPPAAAQADAGAVVVDPPALKGVGHRLGRRRRDPAVEQRRARRAAPRAPARRPPPSVRTPSTTRTSGVRCGARRVARPAGSRRSAGR